MNKQEIKLELKIVNKRARFLRAQLECVEDKILDAIKWNSPIKRSSLTYRFNHLVDAAEFTAIIDKMLMDGKIKTTKKRNKTMYYV